MSILHPTVVTLSASLTLVGCLLCRPAGEWLRLIDRPDGVRRLHKAETPLVGGLMIQIPVLFACFFYALLDPPMGTLMTLNFITIMVLLLGVLDDRFEVAPFWRLAVLVFAATAACVIEPLFVIHTIRLAVFDIEMPLGPLGIAATVFIIVGFVNAVNLADGMNGQFLGSVVVWCGLFLCYDAGFFYWPIIALLVSSAVALFFNMEGRLFSGSAGAYSIAMLLAISTIGLYRLSGGSFHAEIPILWYWLPVVDCLRLLFFRMVNGQSPFLGDRNHLHHYLIDLFGERKSLAVYLGFLAAPGLAAVFDETFGLFVLLFCFISYAFLITYATTNTAVAKRPVPVLR